MKYFIAFLFLSLLGFFTAAAQSIHKSLPSTVDPAEKYLFYLHGGVVQAYGVNAVSPYWGPYEYLTILDTLSARGFRVISERRAKETDSGEYAGLVSRQVDTLLKRRVPPEHIIVVGASMGAGIALDISLRVNHPGVRYALLAICREGSWQSYLEHYDFEKLAFCGSFLSIYERSDSYGSCVEVIGKRNCDAGFEEIVLEMGNGHGFLYKPYEDWVGPLVRWALK